MIDILDLFNIFQDHRDPVAAFLPALDDHRPSRCCRHETVCIAQDDDDHRRRLSDRGWWGMPWLEAEGSQGIEINGYGRRVVEEKTRGSVRGERIINTTSLRQPRRENIIFVIFRIIFFFLACIARASK